MIRSGSTGYLGILTQTILTYLKREVLGEGERGLWELDKGGRGSESRSPDESSTFRSRKGAIYIPR
jgi:hypothetical protein